MFTFSVGSFTGSGSEREHKEQSVAGTPYGSMKPTWSVADQVSRDPLRALLIQKPGKHPGVKEHAGNKC